MLPIGQHVVANNTRQNTSGISATRKVMEVAGYAISDFDGSLGYRLRKVGSSSKGGQTVWTENDIAAV